MTTVGTIGVTTEQWERASPALKTFYAWQGYRPHLLTFIENPIHLRINAIWNRGLAGFLPDYLRHSDDDEAKEVFATEVTTSLCRAKDIGFSDAEIESLLLSTRIESVIYQGLIPYAPLGLFTHSLTPRVLQRETLQKALCNGLCKLYHNEYKSVEDFFKRCPRTETSYFIYKWLSEIIPQKMPWAARDVLHDEEKMYHLSVFIQVQILLTIETSSALKISNTARQCEILASISQEILALASTINDFYHFAVEAASMIPDLWEKNSAFVCIANQLIEGGLVDIAVEVTPKISMEWERIYVLERIVDKLIEFERLQDASLLANQIPKEERRAAALNKIEGVLTPTSTQLVKAF